MQIDKNNSRCNARAKAEKQRHKAMRGALFWITGILGGALVLGLTVPASAQTSPDKAVTGDVSPGSASASGAKTGSSQATTPSAASDGSSAVVFMYHRFGEAEYPSTSIKLDQLSAHIAELEKPKYHVMDVADIVAGLAKGKGLPDRAIGITVDDAYRSFYTQGWPLFKKAGLPVTVFVSTSQLDDGYASYMTWDMVRDLVKQGVKIGGHSDSHAHLSSIPMSDVKAELQKSAQRFKQELGFVPELFAYPYGEASSEVQQAVRDAGYKAAFGQQSGGFDKTADMFYLPRFALNEHYGSLDRFELAANSLPLDVSDLTPADYTLKRNPPAFGFTLLQPAKDVQCYPSDGTATLSRLGEERVEVRLDGPVSPGRWRINCTASGPDGRWRWLGMLYTVPKGLENPG